MKCYTFHIVETRELTLAVEAENLAQAEAIAHAFHYDGIDNEEGLAEAEDLEVTVKVYGTVNEEYDLCD